MPQSSSQELTHLLLAWRQGEREALNRLIPVIYAELRRIAHSYIRGERRGNTLQTTALVNEAYLRLIDCSRVNWQNRAHFLAVSAQLMRRILIDYARSRGYQKHGGAMERISLKESQIVSAGRDPDLVELDEALQALAAVDARKSQVVELRFFGGMTAEETAEVLGVSPDTVLRDWKLARTWLAREMKKQARVQN
ncbi:MAG: polymerase sigma factor [Acidobacteria bacterium]|nr:polymerase sigma factor [Acidobacteriota bacterium]